VAAFMQELAEARRRFRNRVRHSDADDIKTFALAVGDEVRFRLANVRDQKSRSA
jgi:hypothetical protein